MIAPLHYLAIAIGYAVLGVLLGLGGYVFAIAFRRAYLARRKICPLCKGTEEIAVPYVLDGLPLPCSSCLDPQTWEQRMMAKRDAIAAALLIVATKSKPEGPKTP